jgi:hypothetical protein
MITNVDGPTAAAQSGSSPWSRDQVSLARVSARMPVSLRAAVAGLVDDAAIDRVVSPLTRLFGVASREEASVDREAYRSRLLAAVAAVIDGFAARCPTVVCLHDLHWADPSSLELLRQLPGQLTTPTLVIVNHRPTPDLDLPGDRLILGALDHNAIGALFAARLGGMASSSLVSFVATEAGSNAFFVEELASHLAERGALFRSWSTTHGSWRAKPIATASRRPSAPCLRRASIGSTRPHDGSPVRRLWSDATCCIGSSPKSPHCRPSSDRACAPLKTPALCDGTPHRRTCLPVPTRAHARGRLRSPRAPRTSSPSSGRRPRA